MHHATRVALVHPIFQHRRRRLVFCLPETFVLPRLANLLPEFNVTDMGCVKKMTPKSGRTVPAPRLQQLYCVAWRV